MSWKLTSRPRVWRCCTFCQSAHRAERDGDFHVIRMLADCLLL